jgi:tripartite-type tricarboxylate transporter receptor subunit TctC
MFKLSRLVRSAAFASTLLVAASGPALAQWAPNGPIKLIIAFAAGGGADTIARATAEEIEKRKGWSILPEQVTGKGGLNAAVALTKEPGDGTAIAMVVTESLGYNNVAAGKPVSLDQFTPLTTVAGFQMGIVAKADKGWSSFADVIAAAKAGQQIRFGTMSPKLSDIAYLLGAANGVEFNTVQVQGGKAVMDGVQAADMDLGFMAGIQAKGVAAGDLVNLASALSVPLAQSPEAPTMADFGVEFNADGYFAFIAPAGLSDEARAALTEAIIEVVSDPSTKAGGVIAKAFAGAKTIAGGDLAALLDDEATGAEALLKAASE